MASPNRGQKKEKLSDLRRRPPTVQEVIALSNEMYDAHPTATAILGAATVEHDLDEALRSRLARRDEVLWHKLTGDNGPLGTFSRKIQIARALGAIDEATQHNMDIVRNIRNAFAHSKRLLNFDHEGIAVELDRIKIPKYARRQHKECKAVKHGPKAAYVTLCHCISMHLVKRSKKASVAATKRWRKKNPGFARIADLLLPAHSNPFASLAKYPSNPFAPTKTEGPSGGILGDLLRKK